MLWCQTAARLRAEGHSVAASIPAWNPLPRPHQALADAGAHLFLRPRQSPQFVARVLRKLLALRGPASTVSRHLSRADAFRPDLCVISEGSNLSALEWLEAIHARGWPVVTISQAVNIQQWPDDSLRPRLVAAYSGAKRNCFVSRANLEDTQRQLGAFLPHSEVVRNPFAVPYDCAPAWNGQLTPLRLACVGRLHPPAKGQDLLLEVLALPHWRERPVHLSLFGSGPQADALKALAAWRGLANVRFAGHVDDVPGIWAEHHALVLPSRYEGLPLVVVEAMLCQRACIVTRAGGNAELVRDNETGFVAAAPTIELLDEAMNRAWQRREELQALGRRAALAVRDLVPPDPIQKFVTLLIDLAD